MTAIEFNNKLLGIEDKLKYFAFSLTSNSEEAKDLLYKVYCSYLRVFGSEHMSSITSLQNLARVYVEQKQHDIAAKIFRKSSQFKKSVVKDLCLLGI